jgi:hypothetical protein
MCKENGKEQEENKRFAASFVFTWEQFVVIRVTVTATLLCRHNKPRSHGACRTIDSIHHPQSDVVNFTFTKDEKNTVLTHKGIRIQDWGGFLQEIPPSS